MKFKVTKKGRYQTGERDVCPHEFTEQCTDEESWSHVDENSYKYRERRNMRKKSHRKKKYHLGDKDVKTLQQVATKNDVSDNSWEAIGAEPTTTDVRIESSTNSNAKEITLQDKILKECFAILCPCALICRAICQCEMEMLWKLCSSLFVLKAFWSSILVLSICNLFKVHRIIPNIKDDLIGSTTNSVESYMFGLWTYTKKIEQTDHSFIHAVENEIKEVESCHFHMNRVDEDAPEMLFLNDTTFTVVRVIASIVVGVGFISMIMVWLNAANCDGKMGKLIPMALLSCAILECFVFLILGSSVCSDRHIQEQRYCTLQDGSGLIFASIFSWFISFIGNLMVQRYSSAAVPTDAQGLPHCDLYLHESQEVKNADLTFDESFDDSVEDDKSPSQLVIS